MALTDENGGNGMVMPVAPMYGGYGNNGGNGWGGDWAWIILLLLLGWGNNGFGNNAGMLYGGGAGGNALYPWMNQAEITTQGFQNQLLNDNITSIRDGVGNLATQLCGCCGDIQNTLCSGFNGVNMTVNGAQNALSQQLYSNELASLNRSFAEQTANTAGFNGVQSSLCDIRYGNATNTRDIIDSQNRGTQAVLDKLCQLELDGFRRENDDLRQRLNMADLRASQTAQTAELRQSGATQLNQLVSELRSCPIPAQPVYGNQPIFRCAGPAWDNNGGCGCGCGNGSF